MTRGGRFYSIPTSGGKIKEEPATVQRANNLLGTAVGNEYLFLPQRR